MYTHIYSGNKSFRWRFGSLLIIFFPALCFSQVKPADPDIFQQQQLENASQISGEDIDLTEWDERRQYYLVHPLDINNVSFEQFAESGIFNELQIDALLRHISINGKLLSIEELQTIDGFDLASIRTIIPYIIVKPEPDLIRKGLSNILKEGRQQVIIRTQQVLENQKGYSPKENPDDVRYMGSALKLYTRYRFIYNTNVSFGITGEKDAGEEFFKGSNKNGFDFYSAHLFIKDKSLNAVAIGDYQIKYGQGLVLWSGLAQGKTADVLNIKRNNTGIRPYNSVNEFSYLRGVALSYALKRCTVDAFYSNRNLDASISIKDSTNDEALVTSIVEDGYHRTQSELNKKSGVRNALMGGHLNYHITGIDIGITGYHSAYSAPLEKNVQPYDQFFPNGKEFNVLGFNYSYNFHNMLLFGETAHSGNNAWASLNGLLISLDPRASLSLLYRNYSRNYECINCNAFRESGNSNEKGLYIGVALNPLKTISWNSYFDFFSFPWLRYQVNTPSSGTEWLTQITWTPTRNSVIYLRYKAQQKEESHAGEGRTDNLFVARQNNFRINGAYKISASFSLQSRVEYNAFKSGNVPYSNGTLFFQDVSYDKTGNRFTITLRYANFDTDDYDTRIYAYENDIPGVSSIPSYYNKGRRYYGVIKCHISKGVDFWMRFGTTIFDNKTQVGSGYDQINKNHKSDIKLQLKIEF